MTCQDRIRRSKIRINVWSDRGKGVKPFPPRPLTVTTLDVGDVIMTGTPAGVSPLAQGDVVTIAMEGLGVLENPVDVEKLS